LTSKCHDAFISRQNKELSNMGGGHGDRAHRRLLAIWNCMHRMQ
jgi:hypothetical protein